MIFAGRLFPLSAACQIFGIVSPTLNKSLEQGFYTLIMDKFKSSEGYLILAHIRKTAASRKVLHNQVRTILPG